MNFGTPGPLQAIPEDSGHHGDDIESLGSDDLGLERPRHHSIHQIMSAKSAARLFRQRSIDLKKNKRRDEGFSEVSKKILFLYIISALAADYFKRINKAPYLSFFPSLFLSVFLSVSGETGHILQFALL